MFNWEFRRLFNDIVLDEIRRDFKNLKIRNVLDVGCGDGYLLTLIANNFPDIESVYCYEKTNNVLLNKKIKQFSFDFYENYLGFFDIITLIDVIYLINRERLNQLIKKIDYTLCESGISYILLGIYKESRGVKIFNSDIQKLKKNHEITIYSLDELCSLLSNKFNVFIKRINLNDYFGIMPSKLINVKDFIDYIYEDKILIKLTKLSKGNTIG